ncbi:MAG: hypothetical protein WKG07_25495 [Hymenobacter sp.]
MWSICITTPRRRAKTLFATHYHELNQLADDCPRVRNYHVAVQEADGRVLFLRKLRPGGSEHSFGIHVARLAGMPHHRGAAGQRNHAPPGAGARQRRPGGRRSHRVRRRARRPRTRPTNHPETRNQDQEPRPRATCRRGHPRPRCSSACLSPATRLWNACASCWPGWILTRSRRLRRC